jgi:hypothetical protein
MSVSAASSEKFPANDRFFCWVRFPGVAIGTITFVEYTGA